MDNNSVLSHSSYDKKSFRSGVAACTACGIIWGFLPIYWGLLNDVNSMYILANRIIWSAVFMAAYMAAAGRMREIREALRSLKNVRICFVSGILISINWGIYIYAVNNGHVLDSSMGYFVEPVIVAFMGVILFKEKMNRYEKITLAFAVAGMLYMVIMSRILPVIALLLALSFAMYGAVKKSVKLSPQTSLLLETLFMTPFALLFVVYAEMHGCGALGVLSGASWVLIPLCGVITSVPLLLFNIGVKHIPYYMVGILEYVSPSLQFLLGLLYFHESVDINRLTAFIIIWVGISFTLYDRIMHKNEA